VGANVGVTNSNEKGKRTIKARHAESGAKS
jgi:hypothetical protein